MMSFASDDSEPPTAEQLRRMAERFSAPDNEIPGSIALDIALGETADVAVAITSVQVFSRGIQFDLMARLRRSDDEHEHLLGNEVSGGRHCGPTTRSLLIGVEYSDGRTATNLDGVGYGSRIDDEAATLQSGDGGGGGRQYDSTYWLYPLPPPGDLAVICAWPSRGIAETRVVIPAEVIAEASSRVRELWPWESEPEMTRPKPQPPAVPPGGWFARAITPPED